MAAAEAVRESIWQRTFLQEIDCEVTTDDNRMRFRFGDQINTDPVYHERTKHIDVRVHFIRDHVR